MFRDARPLKTDTCSDSDPSCLVCLGFSLGGASCQKCFSLVWFGLVWSGLETFLIDQPIGADDVTVQRPGCPPPDPRQFGDDDPPDLCVLCWDSSLGRGSRHGRLQRCCAWRRCWSVRPRPKPLSQPPPLSLDPAPSSHLPSRLRRFHRTSCTGAV